MAESVDALVSNTSAARRAGSTPAPGTMKACCNDCSRLFVVCDRNVAPFRDICGDLIPSEKVVATMCMYVDEGTKKLAGVEKICEWLFENGADRTSMLIAVGGGITTDICGLAASLYMRGMRFGFIPTTLLAMCDAAIGGKNGVNFAGRKNLLGVIRQPEFVHIDTAFLETLPTRDLRCGSAELLKTFLVADAEAYRKAVACLSDLSGRPSVDWARSSELRGLIDAAVEIKRGIVDRDEQDFGERMSLNLGHSFAHAIESLSKASVPHGEAVAIGIVLAAKVSEDRGIAPMGLSESLRDDLAACGLPVNSLYPLNDLMPFILGDKKSGDGKPRLVLISEPGKITIQTI